MEETLRHGIVIEVTSMANTVLLIVIGQELSPLMAGKLWTLVRMNDDRVGRLALLITI